MKNVISNILFALILIFSVNVQAQSSAIIEANASVQSTLETTSLNSLEFGTVQIRNSKTVSPSDVNAGVVEILGGAGLSININFTLPTNLINGTGDTIPITFSTTSAGYNTSDNGPNTTFNPINGLDVDLHSGQGSGYVYIGGTVDATDPATPSGNYTNSITVTVNYN